MRVVKIPKGGIHLVYVERCCNTFKIKKVSG